MNLDFGAVTTGTLSVSSPAWQRSKEQQRKKEFHWYTTSRDNVIPLEA